MFCNEYRPLFFPPRHFMKYEQDIINLLMQIGDAGLPLMSIVKHVHNAHNSLFEPISEGNVYQSVRTYIIKNSRNEHSLFIKGEDKKYRINKNAAQAKQLALLFTDEEPEDNTPDSQAAELQLPFEW